MVGKPSLMTGKQQKSYTPFEQLCYESFLSLSLHGRIQSFKLNIKGEPIDLRL